MDTEGRTSLADLGRGEAATVADIEPALADDLRREGIHAGSAVTALARAPLRGPIVLRVGRARVAVPLRVAAGIRVVRHRGPSGR
jgi:Fe2+ transport system protein FeoA